MKTLISLTAAITAAVALAACGSSAEDPGAGAAADNARDAARVKLQQCLRGQGVETRAASGGAGRPRPVDVGRLQRALDGPCREEAQAATGVTSPEDRAEFADRFARFSACMRRHGVDLPDVTAKGQPTRPVLIDRDAPRVKTAVKACRTLLPRPGAGGPVAVTSEAP